MIFRVSIALSAFNLTHRWAKNNLHNQKRHIQEFLQVLICCFLIKQTETIVEWKKTGDHCKKHPEQNKINQQRCLIRELNPGHIISSRKELDSTMELCSCFPTCTSQCLTSLTELTTYAVTLPCPPKSELFSIENHLNHH